MSSGTGCGVPHESPSRLACDDVVDVLSVEWSGVIPPKVCNTPFSGVFKNLFTIDSINSSVLSPADVTRKPLFWTSKRELVVFIIVVPYKD